MNSRSKGNTLLRTRNKRSKGLQRLLESTWRPQEKPHSEFKRRSVFVITMDVTIRSERHKQAAPMAILKVVTNRSIFDISRQESLEDLDSFSSIECYILVLFRLRCLSSLFSLFKSCWSAFDIWVCVLWYFSCIPLRDSLTFSMDLSTSNLQSSRDMVPLIRKIGSEAMPQALQTTLTTPPTRMMTVIMNLKNFSPC